MTYRNRLRWYDLDGPASAFAVESGLSEATWFRCSIPRARMQQLMKRSDEPAIRGTLLWLGLAVAAAVGAVYLWPSWWSAPLWLIYGVLYSSASETRRHETSHGTAFRTRRLQHVVLHVASFCRMRDPIVERWRHTRHHTDTLIVGRDLEIDVMRPARLFKLFINLFGLIDVPVQFSLIVEHAFGHLAADERQVVPSSEGPKVFRTARMWLVIYAATITCAVVLRSWIPVLLIGGPQFYGCFLERIYSFTQHAGLGENVLDHRLNTRTILMGPINRFIYWDMNYHIEHHMFPMVPHHKLAELHEELKGDMPTPYPSLFAAYREIIPAVIRQLKDPTYFIKRELPPGAAPYNPPVNGLFVESLVV
jgi:fatty acid desaturase